MNWLDSALGVLLIHDSCTPYPPHLYSLYTTVVVHIHNYGTVKIRLHYGKLQVLRCRYLLLCFIYIQHLSTINSNKQRTERPNMFTVGAVRQYFIDFWKLDYFRIKSIFAKNTIRIYLCVPCKIICSRCYYLYQPQCLFHERRRSVRLAYGWYNSQQEQMEPYRMPWVQG